MKNTLLLLIFATILLSVECKKDEPLPTGLDFRQEMRDFVVEISKYAKSIDSTFLIVPQNGQELITDNGEGSVSLQNIYLAAIDATGRESMFYGYYQDDLITPPEDKQHLLDLCLLCVQNGVDVLATDYCFTHSKMDDSYLLNKQNGFISFAADHRELNNIPAYPVDPYLVNNAEISKISDAKNFLYIINSENYNTKQDFINAVSATNYDLVIMDLFHNGVAFTNTEIDQLKTKSNGAKRLIICYMSIGEAEDYRYYWNKDWKVGSPIWLENENPDWAGNYKVRYWEKDWKRIIYGNDNSYVKMIIDAHFDGVYLDIVDGFEYFEETE